MRLCKKRAQSHAFPAEMIMSKQMPATTEVATSRMERITRLFGDLIVKQNGLIPLDWHMALPVSVYSFRYGATVCNAAVTAMELLSRHPGCLKCPAGCPNDRSR